MLPYLEKKARKNNFAIFTYHDDTILTDSSDNEHVHAEANLNNLKIIQEEEFSTAIDFAPCKCILVSNDEEALKDLEEHWKNAWTERWMFFARSLTFWKSCPAELIKQTP